MCGSCRLFALAPAHVAATRREVPWEVRLTYIAAHALLDNLMEPSTLPTVAPELLTLSSQSQHCHSSVESLPGNQSSALGQSYRSPFEESSFSFCL